MSVAPTVMGRWWLLFCVAAIFAGATLTAETLVEQGYTAMYNMQFDAAHRAFTSYEKIRPGDPLGPVSDAAACLFAQFDRMHILQSEFFLDDKNITNSRKPQPDAGTKARFDADLNETQRLAEAQVQLPGGRANAMFAQTLSLGLRADYLALIDRRDLAALADMKKGRQMAERLLAENPKYYDAYIAVGVENYLLSLKPAPIRWILKVSGAQTDKDDGLKKLGLTAEHGQYLMPYARLLLAVAALRDGDKKKARDQLAWLAAQYPHNSLYREELDKLH